LLALAATSPAPAAPAPRLRLLLRGYLGLRLLAGLALSAL